MAKKRGIAWNERLGPAANARRHLPPLVRNFFVDIRRLMAADPPPAELHILRLAGKRLRYTLELFRPCYGTGLKQRLAGLQKLQHILGEINDAAAAERLLKTVLPPSPARTRACRMLAGRASEKAAELRTYWREVFDAPGSEQQWVRYLARSAKPPNLRLQSRRQ